MKMSKSSKKLQLPLCRLLCRDIHRCQGSVPGPASVQFVSAPTRLIVSVETKNLRSTLGKAYLWTSQACVHRHRKCLLRTRSRSRTRNVDAKPKTNSDRHCRMKHQAHTQIPLRPVTLAAGVGQWYQEQKTTTKPKTRIRTNHLNKNAKGKTTTTNNPTPQRRSRLFFFSFVVLVVVSFFPLFFFCFILLLSLIFLFAARNVTKHGSLMVWTEWNVYIMEAVVVSNFSWASLSYYSMCVCFCSLFFPLYCLSLSLCVWGLDFALANPHSPPLFFFFSFLLLFILCVCTCFSLSISGSWTACVCVWHRGVSLLHLVWYRCCCCYVYPFAVPFPFHHPTVPLLFLVFCCSFCVRVTFSLAVFFQAHCVVFLSFFLSCVLSFCLIK